MKACCLTSLAITLVLFASNPLRAGDETAPESFQSLLKSLSKGVVILTEEIRTLQKDNQQIRAELREIKSQIKAPTPTKAKTPGTLQVERERLAQQNREAESADDTFQSFEYSLSKLRSQRLDLFSEIVSVELAAIDSSETMRFNKVALAENLEIEDEKLRKAREEQLRKVFQQAQAENQQLMDRVEALNAELSVVEKKIEHLEMRIKEARDFRQ